MKKITRFLFCTFVAIMLMGTAISATACHQKEEYPSVPEVTEPQPTGEIIPTVDRQKELKTAKKNNSGIPSSSGTLPATATRTGQSSRSSIGIWMRTM